MGVLDPSEHRLTLPPSTIGLVIIIGQVDGAVLKLGVVGVADMARLGNPRHSGLDTIFFGR